MYAEKDAANLWEIIPNNIDILITHGPPYGILDKTIQNHKAGCKDLLKKVMEVRPQFHIFGHIHESYGREIHEDITFINACSVNLGYRLVNSPQTF
jgi:Icc-related predicted phosphoesterase